MTEANRGQPRRIWYQSAVDPIEQRPYVEQLQAYLDEIADPGFRFEVFGLATPQRGFDPVTHLRCSVEVLHNAVTAEARGYEAFVVGNFPEPGFAEAKSAVDIPVLSLAEASLFHACTLGRKIGLVTVAPEFIPRHEEQVVLYGLRERVVGVRAVNSSVTGLVDAYGDREKIEAIRADFVRQAEPLVELGAEVIVPAGGVAVLLLAREREFTIGGAVVLNGIAVAAKSAEMAIKLRDLTGIGVSRVGPFARPPARALAELLGEG